MKLILVALILAPIAAHAQVAPTPRPYEAKSWSNGAAQIAGSGSSGAAVVSAGQAYSYLRNGENVSQHSFAIIGQSFGQASFEGFAMAGASNGFSGQ